MNSILIAVLVIAATGLLASILLALASHFLKVEEDETAKRIRECLPGANCGACGYAGCDDYANALSNGGVKANLCVPGGDAVASEIASVLGVAADGIARINREKCVGCGLCASACPRKIISIIPNIKEVGVLCSNKDKGAIARKACKNACIGCKKCELNCPEKAISVINNVAVIDYDKCTGCKTCTEGCPTHAIKLI